MVQLPESLQFVLLFGAFVGLGLTYEPDRVRYLPGFGHEPFPFLLYSGMLEVPGPVCGYDRLRIHYQFETTQGDALRDPLVVWQQGGPGASSVVGAYSEMGFFRLGVDANGEVMPFRNPWSWNRLANMLYMEAPAGSGSEYGFSQCIRGGAVVACAWNDTSQAEAFAHTLQAFFEKFPDQAQKDLYITGESYFGQYGTNIAHFILNTQPFTSTFKLKGIALGNACHGGNETSVVCPGFNWNKNIVEFYWRQNFLSPKFYAEVQAMCQFPTGWIGAEINPSPDCEKLLDKMSDIVAHNDTYYLRDNCDITPHETKAVAFLAEDNLWGPRRRPVSLNVAVKPWRRPGSLSATVQPRQCHDGSLRHVSMGGGYPYACTSEDAINNWLVEPAVRDALHLAVPGLSSFSYTMSGPAAITLYPELMRKTRILIYNGDADPLAIYTADQEWIQHFEAEGIIRESVPWAAWHTNVLTTPSGFITRYAVPGSTQNFTFMTVKGSGHRVPQITPEAGLGVLAAVLDVGIPRPATFCTDQGTAG